jgi:3-phenylpropionate/trans-cinnamate dioxygenase ferredoxin reductase subunit
MPGRPGKGGLKPVMRHFDVLIVGGGHAGAETAIALRQLNFTGTIGLVSDEVEEPYERPPLSKEYLNAPIGCEHSRIRPSVFWGDQRIELLLSQSVAVVHASEHRVDLRQGDSLSYDHLVWATGGAPRALPFVPPGVAGVFYLRNKSDADSIKQAVPSARNIVVIGGGYIGLEVTAALVLAGKSVTILEAADRLLSRVAGVPISSFFEREHTARGVDVRTNAQVVSVSAVDGEVASVTLANGDRIDADLLVVGIGIVATVDPLVEAGAQACAGGVRVDDRGRTAIADVFAVGDCAAFSSRHAGGRALRLESIQNANDQAMVVASTIVGLDRRYDALPWFWSDQYDCKLQTVGLAEDYDEIVMRGDEKARSFTVAYLRDGHLCALDCLNALKDFVQGRALVDKRVRIDRARFADPSVPLRTLGLATTSSAGSGSISG